MKKLPKQSLVNRLESVQTQLSEFAFKYYDEENSEYTTELASDASSVIGTIEQFLQTYYSLSNHGVK